MHYHVTTLICKGDTVYYTQPTKLGYTQTHEDYDNMDNDVCPSVAYEGTFMQVWRTHSTHSVENDGCYIVYLHDDVVIHDPAWLDRIHLCITNAHQAGSKVAAVGFGGALSLGHPDIYKTPYHISQMARAGYMSNQDDWQTHGMHETGDRRVAVLDAFCMAVSLKFLHQAGGWPVKILTHHCLDTWLACEAARHGWEIWMTGVSCLHKGGITSTNPIYRNAGWLQGGTLETDHSEPHRCLYEEYVDVLPIRVGELAS